MWGRGEQRASICGPTDGRRSGRARLVAASVVSITLVSAPNDVSPDDFRAALARWPSGVTIVTAAGPVGMTVSAFCSLSLNPALVLVSLARAATMHDPVLAADGFAVHILEHDQPELSTRFATPVDRFDGLAYDTGAFGAPLLHGGVARLVCQKHATADGGDHTILIGRVVQVDAHAGDPLLYYRGGYRRLAPHDG